MEQLQATNEGTCGTSDLTVGLGAKVGAGDTVTYGHDGKAWPQTMDANAWATEFCKLNSASDHGTMLGWFANAIMIGYDTCRWDAEKAKAGEYICEYVGGPEAPNVEVSGLRGFSRRSARLPGWASMLHP